MLENLAKLLAVSLCAGFLIGWLHWMQWQRLFGKHLKPPITYVIGVGVIGAAFSIWTWWSKPTWQMSIGGFWAVAAATGIVDVTSYALRWIGGALQETRTRQDGRLEINCLEGDGPSDLG